MSTSKFQHRNFKVLPSSSIGTSKYFQVPTSELQSTSKFDHPNFRVHRTSNICKKPNNSVHRSSKIRTYQKFEVQSEIGSSIRKLELCQQALTPHTPTLTAFDETPENEEVPASQRILTLKITKEKQSNLSGTKIQSQRQQQKKACEEDIDRKSQAEE